MPQKAENRQRMLVFDGLRGMAALCVVAFHYNNAGPMSLGYLAVDLFFLLSGFVIAAAYEEKLKSGRGLGWFFGVRMARLYPLYLLGLILGAGFLLLRGSNPAMVTGSFFASALFLPNPVLTHDIFPLNGPSWSLSMEVFINLLYALGAYKLSTRHLSIYVAFMGLLLGAVVLTLGSGVGGSFAENYWVGFIRVGFSFPAGVLIWRLRGMSRLPEIRLAGGTVLALALVTFMLPGFHGITDVVSVLVIYPLVVIFGAQAIEPEGRAAQVYSFAGRASYACYALHMPLSTIFAAVSVSYGLQTGMAFFPMMIVVCAAAYWFEPWGKASYERLERYVIDTHRQFLYKTA